MTIASYIKEKKPLILSLLQPFLKGEILQKTSEINRWGGDSISRFYPYLANGKFFRGSLVFLGYDLTTNIEDQKNTAIVAGALELLHTGLLVHDDIMDKDEKRRGGESMHMQYKHILEKSDNTADAAHAGESMATCLGDMTFGLSFALLSSCKTKRISEIQKLFSKELCYVSVAQMQDVYGGSTKRPLTEKEIIKTYLYKTGRYSCALPLILGSLLADASEETISHIWNIGTSLGFLYQIRDDYLNIFGETTLTGKPIGSDIREGKQTLYYHYLMTKADQETKTKLYTVFGNSSITDTDIGFVKNCMEKFGVENDIQHLVDTHKEIVMEGITHTPFEAKGEEILLSLEAYVLERNR